MTRRLMALVLVAFGVAVPASAADDFALDDQLGRTHTRASVFAGEQTVIVAGAQRKTPDAMSAWVDALRPRLPEGSRLYGLSNLKKLPFFVPKGSVKRTLAEKLPATPVLLDWKGKIYPRLGFPDGATAASPCSTGRGSASVSFQVKSVKPASPRCSSFYPREATPRFSGLRRVDSARQDSASTTTSVLRRAGISTCIARHASGLAPCN